MQEHIHSFIKSAPGYQKSSPASKLNSLNFDSQKLFVETLWDHLKLVPYYTCMLQEVPQCKNLYENLYRQTDYAFHI